MKIIRNSNVKRVSSFKEIKGYINEAANEFIITGKNLPESYTEFVFSYQSSLGMIYEKIIEDLFIESLKRFLEEEDNSFTIQYQEYNKIIKINNFKEKINKIFTVINNSHNNPILKFSISKNWIYGDRVNLTFYKTKDSSIEFEPIGRFTLKSNHVYKIKNIYDGYVNLINWVI